ncbi:MAG: cation:proton antiporter [Desulfobacterales bacterium]
MPSILLSIGILYLLAILAGRLSAGIGIPRVTGYLIAGLAAGPSVSGALGIPPIISAEQLHALGPMHDIILGLIVFTIGGSFSLKEIRRFGPKLLRISGIEIGLTAVFVALGTLLSGAPALSAAFLAVISITTAPAATQMVMRECRSEGPLTDTILPLIGINNLAAIVGFILLKHLGLSSDPSFLSVILPVFAPLALGWVTGMVIAIVDQRLTRQVERQILVLAAVAITTGTAASFDLSAILAVLAAGIVAVNASPRGHRILEDLTAIDYPLYVLFFIMAGADLHLETLGHMGLIGIVYVAARTIGKLFGCRIGAAAAGASPILKTWLGPAMLAQAGLAIGLAETLANEWPGTGNALQTVVLASVVAFEMAGPLLTRMSLVQAGEVTVLNLLAQRSPVGYAEGLHQVFDHFKGELGLRSARRIRNLSDMRVGHIMRRNVEVLSNTASFDEVLKALGHSRYDRLPVVDDRNELVGVIKYADIANTLFDPGLRNLVIAHEIATGDYLKLTPEDSLEQAMMALKEHPDDSYLLVVDRDNPRKLIGVVRHNDLLAMQVHP